MTVTPRELTVGYGLPISLSCSVTPPSAVDTPTNISVNWTTPSNRYDRVMRYTVDTVTDELVITSGNFSDSGLYTCSVIVYDTSGSQFIITSQSSSDNASITVGKYSSLITLHS